MYRDSIENNYTDGLMKRVKGQHLFYWVDSVTEFLGCEHNKFMCWMSLTDSQAHMYKPFNYHEILPTDYYTFPYNYNRRIWFFNEDVSFLLMTLSLVIDSFQDNMFE